MFTSCHHLLKGEIMMSLQMLINGLSLGGVYATIAVGFALVYNILKFSNFSHSGILVSTAYIGYFIATRLGTNFWVTLIMTGFFGGCLAILVEFIGFRRLRLKNVNTMLYFVSSITISMLMQNLITVLFSTSYYSYPIFFETTFFPDAYPSCSSISGVCLCVATPYALIFSFTFLLYKWKIKAQNKAPIILFWVLGLYFIVVISSHIFAWLFELLFLDDSNMMTDSNSISSFGGIAAIALYFFLGIKYFKRTKLIKENV